jgi:hypothetical protein
MIEVVSRPSDPKRRCPAHSKTLREVGSGSAVERASCRSYHCPQVWAAFRPIPTGFRPKAQRLPSRRGYPRAPSANHFQPQRGCGHFVFTESQIERTELCRPYRAWRFFGRLTQGVARRLALPWAIIFRAFSPSPSARPSPDSGYLAKFDDSSWIRAELESPGRSDARKAGWPNPQSRAYRRHPEQSPAPPSPCRRWRFPDRKFPDPRR